MATLILKIEYDGTNYGGWQIQPNAPSIQEEIEKVLTELVGNKIGIVGAGRTDAGVHARGQVAHAKLGAKFPVPEKKIPYVLSSKLPDDIRIVDAIIVDYDFHARFDAIAREYSYTITTNQTVFNRLFSTLLRYNLDYNLLIKSGQIFLGKNDFTTFSKYNSETRDYTCNVTICKWKKVSDDTYRLQIRADRFVYGMVRSVVGAMIDIGRGKRTIKEVKQALRVCDRSKVSPLAPAKGLVLEKIYYPNKFHIF
ncbi:MAG: tRNA pseudouridine(38-40) synthase TruA [Ignavibacteriae bacterium]|nr:tRNA pseudouridine(38-40) synthase TruA [Ignavibacteriota bacterium]